MMAAFTDVNKKTADPDQMVKRVLTVAEILSRERCVANTSDFFVENGAEKHDDEEIGYCETKDHLLPT